MSRTFTRVLRPVYIEISPGRKQYLEIIVMFDLNGELYVSGDAHLLCRADAIPAKKYSRKECEKLAKTIFRWHNNHRKQGTEKQEDLLTELYVKSGFSRDFGRSTIQRMGLLEENYGLMVDSGHTYGSHRLKHSVPREVVEYLFTLPQCGKKDTWDMIRYRMFDPIPNEDLQSILDS